jgi:hypothetical protein
MKKLLFSFALLGMFSFMGCKKEPITLNPDPIVNLLVDEEPNEVVDNMGTIIFDEPMLSDVTPLTDVEILDYPSFLDYDPFTMIISRTNKRVDSCVMGIEVTKSERELLYRAHLAKMECQKQNKMILSKIHREIEHWSRTQKKSYYENWYLVEKGKLDDNLKRGTITQSQYKDKIAELDRTWANKMSYLNGQVREKIKLNIERAEACGKIKDCEKEYLNKVLQIIGRTKYKKWIECHKHNYKRKL